MLENIFRVHQLQLLDRNFEKLLTESRLRYELYQGECMVSELNHFSIVDLITIMMSVAKAI